MAEVNDIWSPDEVNKIALDYFDMLIDELSGLPYSKADHRKALMLLLPTRSKGSIEFKHCNISAVLFSLGLPYIDGYKPRFNYQNILVKAVLDWLSRADNALRFVEIAESTISEMPAVSKDIERLTVPIPEPIEPALIDIPGQAIRIDYAEREARNRALGQMGEEYIFQWEIKRLIKYGRPDLAEEIEWSSRDRGDGLGYDIASFDPSTGAKIYIEVKTTRSGQQTPFFVTRREADVSHILGDHFLLYRLYSFAHSPRLYILPGPLDSIARMEPILYRAFPYSIQQRSEPFGETDH